MVQVTVLFHTFPPLMIFFGQTETAVGYQNWVTKAAGATTWCLGDTRYVGGWRGLSYTPAHFKKKNEVTVSKQNFSLFTAKFTKTWCLFVPRLNFQFCTFLKNVPWYSAIQKTWTE